MSLFHADLGAGQTVILLHGFPSCHEMWLPVAEQLAGRYHVILPDLRGHGRTNAPTAVIRMEDHAKDLDALCRALDVERAVFAGVSLGGYLLFEFWRRYKERVRALILCDTRATADTDEVRANRLQSVEEVMKRGPDGFLSGMITKVLGETTRRNRPDIVETARHTMRYSTPAGIAAVQRGMAERSDSTGTLGSINVPVLLLCGDEDVITPVAEMRDLQGKIRNSQFLTMPGAGHFAVLEQPRQTAKAIRNFLDGLTP
jgi:pimeloyl-ACP methyl ester carboxylesterase